ncbi:hypothetical protein J6TS2_35780 [Heyndrickxia sporothermodurans]|nr:hypothetical protein J6TS2_35780 [Heyndrickxia sporothermodurans]
MRKLVELADVCWEGLTLKHVEHRKMFFPYILFMAIAFLFELFLLGLLILSCILFYSFHVQPNLEFYISFLILILMLFITFSVLRTVIKKLNKMIL